MSVLVQISIGTGLLILCAILHIAMSARLVLLLKTRDALRGLLSGGGIILPVSVVFAAFVASHTLHVYLWAVVIWLLGALPGYEEPIYFALVTYTTVGYGDVTLTPDFRILGAMASVTGILMFGLTTAFLVGVFSGSIGADPP